MDESAVGTQFDFGETNNVATGIRTINLEHPIIYAHNNNTLVGTLVEAQKGASPLRVASLRWLSLRVAQKTGISLAPRLAFQGGLM